jgi:hypothetical protein
MFHQFRFWRWLLIVDSIYRPTECLILFPGKHFLASLYQNVNSSVALVLDLTV